MKQRFLKYFSLGIVLTSVLLTSCRKDDFVSGDDPQATLTAGKTLVRVFDGPEKTLFLDAISGIGSVSVFNVRREANSQESLNTASSVTLTAAPDLITAYNTAHATTYETLPESLFTPGAGLTKISTGYTMALNAGDFAKDFLINLNFGLYDFNKKYALAFKITNPGNGTTSSTQGQVLVLISVKNAYDGNYTSVAGTVQRYTAPGSPTVGDALNGSMAGNPDVVISTVNATTVLISNLKWANNGGGIGGIDNLQAVIDPATNLVTMKALGNTTLKNISGAVNKYDPTTKTFTLNFDWNQTANVREVKGLVLTYKSSR